VRNLNNQPVDHFDVDTFLFAFFRQHWLLLHNNKASFVSSVKLRMNQKLPPLNQANKSNKPYEIFSYRFPVQIEFKWPRLLQSPSNDQISPIHFPLTQIHSGLHLRNVTVHNPSNANLLVQALLASNAPHPHRVHQFVQSESSHLFYNHKDRHIIDSLLNSPTTAHSLFRLRNNILTNQNTNKLIINPAVSKQFQQLDIEPDLDQSLIFLLKPNETRTLQVEFSPDRLGAHYDLLLFRNNLTILDAQLISGHVGTAELRINNLPPMKSSLFFNEMSQQNSATAAG